jgi:probable rRNA maturation factor
MVNLFISDPYHRLVEPLALEKAVLYVLEHQAAQDGDVTVLIEGDQRVRELNFQFLEIDAPTDVLSFPSDEIDPETGSKYLGDIIISYPRADEQAKAAGHPIDSELLLLVVHGTLHLLGYDHAEDDEKKEMWAVQEEILSDLGVKLTRFLDD